MARRKFTFLAPFCPPDRLPLGLRGWQFFVLGESAIFSHRIAIIIYDMNKSNKVSKPVKTKYNLLCVYAARLRGLEVLSRAVNADLTSVIPQNTTAYSYSLLRAQGLPLNTESLISLSDVKS